MIYFLLNLFLAAAWMLLNGAYSGLDFMIGYFVGFFALWLVQPFGLKTSYFTKLKASVLLLIVFLKEIFVSVAKIVWDVATPQQFSNPEIIYVPLDAKNDLEITILANMVSLTPGSLSLDVTPDKKYLIVHAMYAADPEQVIHDIKSGMEARLLEVTRG